MSLVSLPCAIRREMRPSFDPQSRESVRILLRFLTGTIVLGRYVAHRGASHSKEREEQQRRGCRRVHVQHSL